MKILHETLEQMNPTFSSYEFAKQARENGLTEVERVRELRKFLYKFAEKGDTQKMWKKKEPQEVEENDLFRAADMEAVKEQEAVDLLKRLGYKIMKPVSEWVEL